MGAKTTVPKWSAWISFVLFSIVGVALGVLAIYNLQFFFESPGRVLGSTFMNVLILYFISVIPSTIIWEYLKNN